MTRAGEFSYVGATSELPGEQFSTVLRPLPFPLQHCYG